jgi:hypothetical protein
MSFVQHGVVLSDVEQQVEVRCGWEVGSNTVKQYKRDASNVLRTVAEAVASAFARLTLTPDDGRALVGGR